MYPQLKIWLDEQTEPQTILALTDDLSTYYGLVPEKKQNEAAMRLVFAYLHLVDQDPKTYDEVRKWAREHKVLVQYGEAVNPTQTATLDES